MSKEAWVFAAIAAVSWVEVAVWQRRARTADARAWRKLITKMRDLADWAETRGDPVEGRRYASKVRGMADAWEYRGEPGP